MTIPKSHPRYHSLMTRERIEKGLAEGIVAPGGLIAHGRGEAYDYLLGEKTRSFARVAIEEAARILLEAKHPVISVNGNTAALVPGELVSLSALIGAALEVNIFHPSKSREQNIAAYLQKHGGRTVLLPQKSCTIAHLESNRRFVHTEGIKCADVVFVPLEDGDRCEALIQNGKKVITVDLNPLSRTAQTASITIVDNILRAIPLLIKEVKKYQTRRKPDSDSLYQNAGILHEATQFIVRRFAK